MPRRKKRKILSFSFLSFFLVVAFLLAEANLTVYSALVSIFNVPNKGMFLFALILAIFSGGFILMLILEKYFGNYIIRFFYFSTSLWMGAFVYIFTASLIYIALSLFFNVPDFIGVWLLVVAFFVSWYGISHGSKIFVKNINVSLPNLPKEWKGKRVAWISDVHLNSVRRVKFARRIVNSINSLKPEVVFIGGDLFDGTQRPDPYLISKPFKDIVSKFGTYYILGNHEEYDDPSVFIETVESLGIKVLKDQLTEINGLQIVGVDYLSTLRKDQFQKILENLRINNNKPSILLKHEPKDLDVAERMGISFQISGHTHRGQQWPFNYLTWIAYKGYGYGLKKYKNMEVYVSSGVGGWGPPLRIGSDGEVVSITLE